MPLLFNFNGTRYEGRPDIVKDIEGLVATCEALGPDPKYAELEKAKGATFKSTTPGKITPPKFKVKPKKK